MSTPVLRIALAGRQLTAVWPAGDGGADRVVSVPIDAPLIDGQASRAALSEAFRAITEQLGAQRPRALVALLPPFVSVRTLGFPPLRHRELMQVVARDPARYFAGAVGPQVVAVRVLGRAEGRLRVLAACTPSWLLHALATAAAEQGIRIRSFAPAHEAWARWLRSGGTASADGLVVHAEGDRSTEVLAVSEVGQVVGVRRCPTDPERVAAALTDLGVATPVHLGVGSADPDDVACSPACVAAEFAEEETALPLVHPSVVVAREKTTRRYARALWVAAAALVALAVGLQRFALDRELEALRAARLAHRDLLQVVMDTRDSGAVVADRLAVLGEGAGSPRWSEVLGQMAKALPRDAYLTGLRFTGDSVMLEGVATRAATVFTGLGGAAALSQVRPSGPIRQEVPDSGPPVERFAATAVLRRVGSAP